MMKRLFSYVLRIDDGAAPNPFWGICTLTICKPTIRRVANIGDWVVGLGSKKVRCNDGKIRDFSGHVVYAMKITQKLSLVEYDNYCKANLPNKIPDWNNKDWRRVVGDCLYDYSMGLYPIQRQGVHGEGDIARDLRGKDSLLSDYFYYFGETPELLLPELYPIVHQNQNHKKTEDEKLIADFENWIKTFSLNELYADPQMKWIIETKDKEKEIRGCANITCQEDENKSEEVIPCRGCNS